MSSSSSFVGSCGGEDKNQTINMQLTVLFKRKEMPARHDQGKQALIMRPGSVSKERPSVQLALWLRALQGQEVEWYPPARSSRPLLWDRCTHGGRRKKKLNLESDGIEFTYKGSPILCVSSLISLGKSPTLPHCHFFT